ncbi:DUF6090 family protein [uncultured Eudoraea sp.]|jgi:hypothetical protein|uniref:DUF6090 family protein n=1 Tax=uncultured Eudoraea sp. TaxID=1035614 RepID=UPI00260A4687|nr:DUF6090 family protein [uncultured Eudoraea sp.]
MIKFFRKIRQQLLTENPPAGRAGKFSKYLIYGIGEVVLIVIGILLALYLNNINSEQKSKLVEIELLNELKSNINSSIKSFERTLEWEREYLGYNLLILDYLDNKKPFDDRLLKPFATYFWTVSSNPISGGYTYLKSKGIDLITNDSLRKNLSVLFENEYLIIKEENQVWANNLQQNISYPYHVSHFRRYFLKDSISGDIEVAKPFNYNALIYDNKFKSINAEIISNRNWNINSLQDLIIKSEVVVKEIEDELKFLYDQK